MRRLLEVVKRGAGFHRLRRKMELRDAYRDVFDSDSGRLVLADLAQIAGHGQPFAGDPHRTAYNCGKAAVFTHIQTMAALTDRQIMRALEFKAEGDEEAMARDHG